MTMSREPTKRTSDAMLFTQQHPCVLTGCLIALFVTVSATGCAHRVVVPPPPKSYDRATELSGVDLVIDEFYVEDLSSGDKAAVKALRRSFTDYLRESVRFGSINQLGDHGAYLGEYNLHVDVRIAPSHTTGRTVVFDALAALPVIVPPLVGLFVPVWGQARAELEVRVTDADHRLLAEYHRTAYDRYWCLFYSWYRTQYIEDAYADVYEALFTSVSFEMARDAPRLAKAIGAEPDHSSVASAPLSPAHRNDWRTTLATEPRGEELRLITESASPPFDGFYSYLKLLGGLEVAAFTGFAEVASSYEDEYGKPVKVAAGSATQQGFRIALYSAPKKTGFFWYPVVGFVWQDVAIGEFRDSWDNYYQPEDIEPICSDPDTGENLDCGAPNVYELSMRSGYAGLRGGWELAVGHSWFVFFASVSLGINLLEFRSLRAVVGTDDATETGFDFVRSGAVGGTVGVSFPKAHLALRLIFEGELYREFEYAHEIPFKGPPAYNSDKQIVERPLRFVQAASLHSFVMQTALAFVF
ncbi:MAG: hypothetical protein A2289_05215 [Deltaproteobacteria bacterium RIFOXYA12_FULL_58_15]|nr:MAG: hypothetical protein A2289_05215 [Deltaproteobacteria bacterium RIFOXYA12_FULL_58_15]OGR08573.1 MAG: hypothetical protein A2341_25550 [Deltaproteobacteria bacterium RIFOXYB12_FULL_58_9]